VVAGAGRSEGRVKPHPAYLASFHPRTGGAIHEQYATEAGPTADPLARHGVITATGEAVYALAGSMFWYRIDAFRALCAGAADPRYRALAVTVRDDPSQSVTDLRAPAGVRGLQEVSVSEAPTKTATFVRVVFASEGKHRELFRVDPPMAHESAPVCPRCKHVNGSEYVVVSAVDAYSGPETFIFKSNEAGNIEDWLELPGSFAGDRDIDRALVGAGYTVVRS
jgi:hypothetical protein